MNDNYSQMGHLTETPIGLPTLCRDGVGCYGGWRQLLRAHWRRDKRITFNSGMDSVVKTKRPTRFEWQR